MAMLNNQMVYIYIYVGSHTHSTRESYRASLLSLGHESASGHCYDTTCRTIWTSTLLIFPIFGFFLLVHQATLDIGARSEDTLITSSWDHHAILHPSEVIYQVAKLRRPFCIMGHQPSLVTHHFIIIGLVDGGIGSFPHILSEGHHIAAPFFHVLHPWWQLGHAYLVRSSWGHRLRHWTTIGSIRLGRIILTQTLGGIVHRSMRRNTWDVIPSFLSFHHMLHQCWQGSAVSGLVHEAKALLLVSIGPRRHWRTRHDSPSKVTRSAALMSDVAARTRSLKALLASVTHI